MSSRQSPGPTPEPTSSLAPDCGRSPPSSPVGPPTGPSGPRAAPASPSVRPGKVSVSTIQGICGPTSFASSAPAGPLQSWENRLRDRLAMVGSTESALIWREKVTPAGRSISRLAPWTPPTGDSGSTGSPWPTPRANNEGATMTGTDRAGWDLPTKMVTSQWPTPTVRDGEKSPLRALPNDPRRSQLNDKMQAQWPTPTVADVEGGRKTRSGERSGEMLLNGLMGQWPTPRVSAGGGNGKPERMMDGGNCRLEDTIAGVAQWSTPRATDGSNGGPNMSFGAGGTPLPTQMAHSGPTPTGSTAQTGKRGAPNPEFACWLMGWPEEFTCGVLRAIQSFPKSRRRC